MTQQVRFMFPIFNPIVRHPPSLLSGFPWANFPDFISTRRMLRLPSLISLPSVSLGFDTTYDVALFLSFNWVATYTQLTWIVRVWSIHNTTFRVEAGGSPVFPCKPICLWYSQRPRSDWYYFVINIIPILHQQDWQLMLQRLDSFEANTIPLAVAVYASCQHLYWLCKTRFQWLTKSFCTGLVTCGFAKRCFIINIIRQI